MSSISAVYELIDERTLDILQRRQIVNGMKRRGWLVRRALLVSDVVGLTAAFLGAELVSGASYRGGHVNAWGESILFCASLPLWVVAAKLYKLYDRDEERVDQTTSDDFVGVFHLVTVCTFLFLAFAGQTGVFHLGFRKLLVFWLLAIGVITVLRAAARAYCRRRLEYLQNTIILGAGSVGQDIARKVLKHHEYGLNLVGFVDAQPKEPAAGLDHVTLLGSHDELASLVKLLDVERVIVAFSNESDDEVIDILRDLNELEIQVDIIPRYFDILHAGTDIHTVAGLPLLSVLPNRLSRSSRLVKRILDVIGAGLGLVILSPLFALVALAIKLDSPGPVFFRQVRMGEGHETFRIWKFRSMVSDAEDRKGALGHLNKHLAPGGDPRMFKIEDDPRITRVGGMLRRTAIDELPQLFNVLVGDMSLVGPRPLVLDESQYVNGWGHRRLDLRPGITGLWQVLGSDDIGFEEMVRLDYRYVTAWSLWRDVSLLSRTVPAVARRRART